jgi:hypothetical protein
LENLSFQYPTWYLLLCGLLGLVYALIVYFRNDTFKDQSAWLNWLLGTVRFLTASFLAVLLLSPLIKSLLTDTKKPVIILAQDQSESVLEEMDESALAAYKSAYENLKSSLSETYDLKEYAFGSQVREGVDFNFTDKVSNLSEMLRSLYDLYSNQNLGAVVLASDGIYNEGSNPIYASNRLAAPIFTVALGDTTPQKDLLIKRVYHNKIAYLGDRFNIEVDILAKNCPNTRSNLRVSKIENGQSRQLQEIPISINKNDFFQTQEITLDADKAGVQRFRVALTAVKDEITTTNNVKDIFIDVLDARQKILVLAHSPHPDLTAIRQSISKNKNYEIKIEYIDRMKANIADYNFIILHQLPGVNKNVNAVLENIKTKKLPHLFIVGSQSDLNQLNAAQSLLSISGDGRNTNEVQGNIDPNFSLFTIEDATKNSIPNFAPLIAPFGEFKEAVNAQVVLFQRIGKIDTKYPLLVLGEQEGVKKGILAAEGIWKWRLFDYLQHKNHDIFEEILGKTVQYLTLKEDKRRFRINLVKNIFFENEPILLNAEVYNDNYELINNADVSLIIRDKEGKEFPSTFNKTSRAYSLNAGVFPVGNYTFSGTTFHNGKQLDYNGQFSVQPIQLESFERTANHGLLRLLSEQYGGEMVYPAQLASISDKIKEKKSVKPVIYQTTKTRSIINLKWICFLLMSLLTLEWFMRRYHGSY